MTGIGSWGGGSGGKLRKRFGSWESNGVNFKTGKTIHQVKVLDAKSDNLSSSPGTHRLAREKQLPQWPSDVHICMPWQEHTTQTHHA